MLVTWGATLRLWSPRLGSASQVILRGPFEEGGCLLDGSFVGVSHGQLLAVDLRNRASQVIDTEAEVHDCIPATLFGRRGVLAVQRGMQVRFYERSGKRWKRRDVYSIYTPSYQGGLGLADVNGDGLTDIVCGNYWIESPRRFEKPWRLFAIHTWFEEQDSATLRIAVRSASSLVAAQAHRGPARIATFRAPQDVRQLWISAPLWPELALNYVHGLAVWNGRVVAGENHGEPSRIVLDGKVFATGFPTTGLLPLDKNRLLAVGPKGVRIYLAP